MNSSWSFCKADITVMVSVTPSGNLAGSYYLVQWDIGTRKNFSCPLPLSLHTPFLCVICNVNSGQPQYTRRLSSVVRFLRQDMPGKPSGSPKVAI